MVAYSANNTTFPILFSFSELVVNIGNGNNIIFTTFSLYSIDIFSEFQLGSSVNNIVNAQSNFLD